MTDDAALRIRFDSLDMRKLPDGRCSARVVLSWSGGAPIVGTAEGMTSDVGVLQCAARAAARAVDAAAEDRTHLSLLGVTTIKAFDAIIVVVSLANHTAEGEQRLVGSAVANERGQEAAVRAVLNATNRLLSALLGTQTPRRVDA